MKRRRRPNPIGRLLVEIFWEALCLVALAFIAFAVVVDRMRSR
jgi:hypothetical protein